MKSLLIGLLILAGIFIVNSCQKESLDSEISNPEIIDHSKDFLKELKISRTDRSSPNYICGEFDGKLIYFTTIEEAYSYDDISWNGIFIRNSNGLDQINLIRQTNNDSVKFAVFINESNIFTRQFPYRFKEGGYAMIELNNLNKPGTFVPGSSDDVSNFYGNTRDGFTFVVTSFVDNIMEGTFEGALKSYSGSTIMVKNGRFHMKVKIDKS